MTTGVQNIEPAAYLPPPPSTSTSDAKGIGATDRPTADTQGGPSDFQNELQRQDQATKEAKSKSRPETGSGKPGKKRDTRPEDPNPSLMTPIQVAEPQKQALPLALALLKPDENAEEPAEQGKEEPQSALTALPQPLDPNQIPTGNAALAATPDSSDAQTLQAAVDVPVPEPSAQNQRPSRAELKLAGATPPEPAAAAIQETLDSAPPSSPALAFAARLAGAPQKAGESVPENPSQPLAAPGSQTPARIPSRFAATAQVLENDDEELKKDAGAALDRAFRNDVRTDMFPQRLETAREAAPSSGPAAPQQPVPTARLERVIEPPPAPPSSSHDIRVRVPDNNGGSTQVRFVESGGEVRVSVRTADEGLAQNLRSHLSDLTQRLADGGIPAEFWKPGSNSASSQNNQQQPDRDGRGSGGQESGGQGRQQDRQEKQPAWLEEMEASLHGKN